MKMSIVLILLLTGCAVSNGGDTQVNGDVSRADEAIVYELYEFGKTPLSCNFYNQRDFDLYIEEAQVYADTGTILSGTVPHHLLAGRLIASFFATAARNRPNIETVIITAPMHKPTDAALCTTLSDWATPFGALTNERDFSEVFISQLNAKEDDVMLVNDHSAAALIPFVKYYFPDASVCVILIANFAESNTPKRLSEIYAQFAEEKNCLFVFSVDFSHYLNPAQTEAKDIETREVVMNNELDRISFMTDANMDSPRTVCAFLLLNKLLGANLYEFDHSNSLKISRYPPSHPIFDDGLTSYFIFAGALP